MNPERLANHEAPSKGNPDSMKFAQDLRRRGREIGAVLLADEAGIVWQVKVRCGGGKWGRYLVIKPHGQEEPRILACADRDAEEGFLQIDAETWNEFARFARNKPEWPTFMSNPEGMRALRAGLAAVVSRTRSELAKSA